MKPKHKPPETLQLEHDPKLVLIALNLLIEAHKSKTIPAELVHWVKAEIVDKGLEHLELPRQSKRAA